MLCTQVWGLNVPTAQRHQGQLRMWDLRKLSSAEQRIALDYGLYVSCHSSLTYTVIIFDLLTLKTIWNGKLQYTCEQSKKNQVINHISGV